MKRSFLNQPVLIHYSLVLTLTLVTAGCARFSRSKAETHRRLEEQSRALTTAVVDALQAQPMAERDRTSELALQFAREDQRIEGLPLEPIAVAPLLAETNSVERTAAERQMERRFAAIERLLQSERRAIDRLQNYGEVYEAQQHALSWRRWKWGSAAIFVIVGLAALLFFVPAAAPLIGRILAWLVAKVPSFAGALGVVGVQAFDAVVKGIERSRADERTAGLENHLGSAVASRSSVPALELNLSREMDASHKALVRARKAALK